jgi:hypothetical protein
MLTGHKEQTAKDVKKMLSLLYAKARGAELRREAERSRRRAEAREIRRGR